MLAAILDRIDSRLRRVGISGYAVCSLSGQSGALIAQWRRGVRCGKRYTPKFQTLAALAPALYTTPQWLWDGAGPEEVMPDAETQAKVAAAKARGRRKPADAKGDIRGDVIVKDNDAPVILVDQSQGEGNVSGSPHAAGARGLAATQAAELFGLVLEAVANAHKAKRRKIQTAELGRIAFRHHADLAAMVKHPDEFPLVIEMVRLRVDRELDPAEPPATKEGG